MNNENDAGKAPKRVQDLHDLIDKKIGDIIVEANAGGWNVEEATLAINDVIRARWLARKREITRLGSQDIVSNGNEV